MAVGPDMGSGLVRLIGIGSVSRLKNLLDFVDWPWPGDGEGEIS